MSINDKKNQKTKNSKEKHLNKDKQNDNYDVDIKESLKTVFNDEKKEILEKEIENIDENVPQSKEDYKVRSQILKQETERLAPINISLEMKKSFLEYAMSVIIDRALPDARDGLKPVHRRILFGMYELGLTSGAQYKKSARVVGDVLGKYHPHGDSSVYEAMVRLSQDFAMRYPMVDGHGNFGSIDGDGAAAMRYTEVRMSKIAGKMIEGIKKETVDFVANYDGSEIEPSVLPSRIPNLLISGSTGIAVGMATSIPPHNLKNIIEAVIALAKNKDISIEELITIVEGPDFPTGGIIIGSSTIKNAYLCGQGSIKVRSKTNIEEIKNGKKRIIVTEIPFMVNKAHMIEKIAYLIKEKRITGITDLRDETSRKGIRIVIELKKNIIPEVIQNKLFKMTQMQSNFSINMVALVNNKPQLLNLKQILLIYFKYQKEIVKKRTFFDLKKAQNRKHLLDGLKIATENIEEFVKIIKSSKNDDDAQVELINAYSLSKIQAKAITDMRLGRLTGLAIEKMNEEIIELKNIIINLQNILNNEKVLIDLIIKELSDTKDLYADKRRTEINDLIGEIEDEDLIPQKDVAITMSNHGYVKRISLEEYHLQNRGGIGARGMDTYDDDYVEKIIATNTHTDLLIFTSFGKVYKTRVYKIIETSKQSKGIPFINIIPIQKNEKIVSLLTINKYNNQESLLTVTKLGIVKKTAISKYSRINVNGKIALKIKDGDELVKAMLVDDEHQIIIGSSMGKVVKFNSIQIRKTGRATEGVKGIKISKKTNDKVVGASVTKKDFGYIFSTGENGFGKKTLVAEYRQTNRDAKGVKSINIKKAGYLKFVEIVKGNEDILIITKYGTTIRVNLSQVATSGRNCKGVKIISLKKGNKIKSIAVVNIENITTKNISAEN